MELITWSDELFVLGVDEIDDFRREFVVIVNALDHASGSAFIGLFAELLYHTRDYFEVENNLMKKSGFPARHEHEIEHRQIVGELARLQQRLKKGHIAMVRSYVRERLPDWFMLHAGTMDRTLIAHLKQKRLPESEIPRTHQSQKPMSLY
jgi:hemerythrin-like metal-binding protein